MNRLFVLMMLCLSRNVWSEEVIQGAVEKQPLNIPAVIMFLVFVAVTLVITYWAAKRNQTVSDHYTGGGGITGFQNGLAIAGDYMSAASFLGISSLVYLSGYDGLIYAIGALIGWPLILFLIAERLRNLGRFTFSDVASYRLGQLPIRTLSAFGTLAVVTLYLIAQMVGAGKLIQLLFGLPYEFAVILVGGLMILYASLGGMLATTWVQIIKAVLLLSGASFMVFMVLKHVDFDINELFQQAVTAHPEGLDILTPGGLVSDPISAISLGVAMIFGTAGLPHILMRFFTVADAKEARKSVLYATGFIGYFFILIFVIGFGAIVLISNNPDFFTKDGNLIGGNNMAAIHLSRAVGGDLFLGFISAVAFATILAVVSGLTLAGASAISHDLYACVIKRGKVTGTEEIRVSRIATVALGIIAIVLGFLFEDQNIAYMIGLTFAIAASSNFPVLILSMYWKNLTTRGAFIGGFTGLITSVALVILGPIVWVDILGNEEAIFPYKYPALFSVTVAFVSIWFFSIMDRSEAAEKERKLFEHQYIRSQTGIGAYGSSEH